MSLIEASAAGEPMGPPSASPVSIDGAVNTELIHEVTKKLNDGEHCVDFLRKILLALQQGRLSVETLLKSSGCRDLLKAVCSCSLTERIRAEECYEYRDEDFFGTRQKLEISAPLLFAVLSSDAFTNEALARELIADVALVAGMNDCKQPWNVDTVVHHLSEALGGLTRILSCTSICKLLQYEASDAGRPVTVAAHVAGYVRGHMQRNEWKRWPGAQAALLWLLRGLEFPAMSDYIDTLVPASLLFTDDYALENKITGVKCLSRIMEQCGKTELTWHDRANVMYQALHHLTYTKESSVVAVLYPCLLRVLDVVERCPPYDQGGSVSRHDIIFERLLDEMYTEDKIVLRQAYSAHLPLFIDRLAVYTTKHLKKLLLVVQSYLEFGDSPEEIARTSILVALERATLYCWPRISSPSHTSALVAALGKLLIDVIADDQHSPGAHSLVEHTKRCLALLAKCSDLARNALCEMQAAAKSAQGLDLAADCFGKATQMAL